MKVQPDEICVRVPIGKGKIHIVIFPKLNKLQYEIVIIYPLGKLGRTKKDED